MSLHRSCSSSFESCLSNCLAIGRSEERWCLAESSSSKGFIRHSSVVALVKSWLSMGRCERCSSAAEHGKGDTRDAGGGRGISTGRAGGTRRSRGDLPRRAPGSRLFEDSVVATRRSGRLGSAGREALNAPACGLAARSGARAAEIGLVSVRRTEEREARAGVEPRGARERLGEVQLSVAAQPHRWRGVQPDRWTSPRLRDARPDRDGHRVARARDATGAMAIA